MFKDLHAWASEDATRRADGWIVQDVRLSFGAGKVLVRRVAELVEVGLDVVRHPARLLDFVVPSRLLDRSLLDSSVPLDALIRHRHHHSRVDFIAPETPMFVSEAIDSCSLF